MVQVKVRYDGKVLIPEDPVELPRGVVLDCMVETSGSKGNGNLLEALRGLGAEVWKGIDPVEYQHKEREGWE